MVPSIYIYAKSVDVETDHKPLGAIFEKNLFSLTLHVQKMMLKLQRYDLKVRYKPEKEMYVADALSRAYLPETPEILYDEQLDVNIMETLPMSQSKLEEFHQATIDSTSLQQLKSVVLNGWP